MSIVWMDRPPDCCMLLHLNTAAGALWASIFMLLSFRNIEPHSYLTRRDTGRMPTVPVEHVHYVLLLHDVFYVDVGR
jgi:hypothetical protein